MFQVVEPGDRPPLYEGWIDSSVPRHIGFEFYTVQSLGRLLELAYQSAMQLGESYRGFIVGAAALAIDRSGTKTGIYVDGNYTPFEGAEWNCAEKRLLEKVEERGFERIEAIAVSGPFQPDGESLLMSPTLHPCGRCRRRLQASPLTHPNTLIASVNLSETRYELFTIESLSKFHETGEPQPFPVYHPALEQYWRLALEFDRADELREQRILEGIAEIIHGQNI